MDCLSLAEVCSDCLMFVSRLLSRCVLSLLRCVIVFVMRVFWLCEKFISYLVWVFPDFVIVVSSRLLSRCVLSV